MTILITGGNGLLANNLKTVSSRYIRKEFSDHLKRPYWKDFFCLGHMAL